MEHLGRVVGGTFLLVDPLHVFDANIFYPHDLTLAYSENNSAPGSSRLSRTGCRGTRLAHNVVVLAAFTLSAAGMYFLARRLTASPGAAAVAAVTFAFCPYVFGRTPHIQLLVTSGLPFTMLAFHALLNSPRPGAASCWRWR